MSGEIYFDNNVGQALGRAIRATGCPTVFTLCDTNTNGLVLPRLRESCPELAGARNIVIEAGDTAKTIATAAQVWEQLMDGGATRNSLLVNIGGGMVTDLGGFAAATYKRGMPCLNVPTTLLGAVDAAVGGKTAVNFMSLKNLVGVFRQPEAVVISTAFFDTLPQSELMSGYAEMIKHGLLSDARHFAALIDFRPAVPIPDHDRMLDLLTESVSVKARIVAADPTERGLRKALNLGHTIGHAFETLAMRRGKPVPHGYAVAWGLVTESVLSHLHRNFPSELLHTLAGYVCANYGAFAITCDDYPALIAYMRQDKKNASADAINFTLLDTPGKPVLDVTLPAAEITAALDIYRDLLHI